VTVSEPPETPLREELLASEREEPPVALDPVARGRSLTRAVDGNENRHNSASHFAILLLVQEDLSTRLFGHRSFQSGDFSDNDEYMARVSLREARCLSDIDFRERDI